MPSMKLYHVIDVQAHDDVLTNGASAKKEWSDLLATNKFVLMSAALTWDEAYAIWRMADVCAGMGGEARHVILSKLPVYLC